MADSPGPGWLQSVVEATTDGLWVLDRRGRTLWANAAMAALLRREAGSMVGLPAHEVFPRSQRSRVEMHLSMLARGTRGRDNLPVTLERADSTQVDGLLSYSPVREAGRITGWLHRFTPYAVSGGAAPAGSDPATSMLARQLAEAQEIAGIGSFSWDLLTGRVTWSDQLHRLYGVAPEDFDGTYEAFAACLHPEDRERVRAATQAALADRDSYEFDARVQRPDGELRWMHGRCRITRDPADGRALRIDGTNQDVTEVRRVEEAAAAVVAEREAAAEQLAEARDRAMEASRMKSEFLATMSHEIRTPMNGVIGLNELLLRTDLDDHQRRLADGVHQSGLSLLAIINDILDLSKIEAGKLELEDVDFEVRSVFEQAASVLAGPAHEKGIELVVACHPEVPEYLRGDPTRLGQVLTNLGSNAVKFTEHGEVSIQARVQQQDPRGLVLRVDVTDTGIGIPAAAQEALFDAFTQADLATTRRHGGTGLGLAICQQLVEAMHGRILVDSAPGQGSTFSFTAHLAHTPSAPRRHQVGPESLRGQRVLVVDDNETNRFILTEQLKAWQLEAVAVPTPAECLSTLREAHRAGTPFTLVLLDLVLPRIDGLELARIIRADPTLSDLTLVLLTSDQGVGARTAREAGISTTLSKPVRHSELYDAIVRTLGGTEHPAPRSPRRLVVPSLDLRVLVVEDNPVNQLVATGLLEALGVTVDVADDGEAAVAALHGDHGYALVLMDCRMPGIDGFDATRAIRASEPADVRVPIIAMTASALEGERERCLDAGMDDFLTKPVDPTQLEEVVERWTKRSGPASDRAAAASETSTSGFSPVAAPDDPTGTGAPHARGALPDSPVTRGLEVVDEDRRALLAELVKDGESFFDRTARSFLGRIDAQVREIRDRRQAGDAHGTFTSAHLVKGSALNLGLPRVSAAAAEIESHAHGGDLTGIDPMLEELEREVEIAVAELRRRLR